MTPNMLLLCCLTVLCREGRSECFSEKAFLKPPELRPSGQESGEHIFTAVYGCPKVPQHKKVTKSESKEVLIHREGTKP